MNNEGLLVIISGPSGVGKGTVLHRYMEQNKNVKVSVSATTRTPRPGEVDGVHYHFMEHPEFEALVKNDGMLEHAQYSGNWYGTPRAAVERELQAGNDVVLEIEVQGAKKVKSKCPQALTIFILPPSFEELTKRLVERRTEDTKTIERRLRVARQELEQAGAYDYIVINDTVDNAVQKIGAILCAAKCSTHYRKDLIGDVQKLWNKTC